MRFCSCATGPFQLGAADHLGPVVDDYHGGFAAAEHEGVQLARQPVAADRGADKQGQGLPSEVVDDA